MRLGDFVQVEFARAWQEERGASVVDPAVIELVVAEEVEESSDAPRDDDARLVRYAERLLAVRVEGEDGPGSVATLRAGLTAAWLVLPLLGVLAGGLLLEASLPPNDVRPVNVFGVVAEGIVLPGIFLIGTLILATGAGRLTARLHWLVWVLGWLQGRTLRTRVGSLAGRVLRRSGVAGPLFAALSHLFWIGALLSLLGFATWRFAFDDYLFSWSSTMPVGAEGVQTLFEVLTAPVEWVPGVDAPTAVQVDVSRYASLEADWPRSSGDPAQDMSLRKGWYALLLAVVAFWGLLPRLAGLGLATFGVKRGIRQALASPSNRAVLDAMNAAGTIVQRGTDEGRADPRPARLAGSGGAARPGQGLDVIAFATPRPGDAVLEALGLDRLGLSGTLLAVADDDDEAEMSAVLAALAAPDTAPGGAVLVFDVSFTPGRVRERFVADVVGTLGADSPVHLLLTEVDRFRRSPRGRDFEARHTSWKEMAARAGVDGDRVHLDSVS